VAVTGLDLSLRAKIVFVKNKKIMADTIRVDKWLWSVRLYKSRTIATNACKESKIKVGEKNAKPSFEVKLSDIVHVKKNGFNFQFKVLRILPSRVGAPIAITAYEDVTPLEELNKYKAWFTGKAQSEQRDRGTGRPTKKERRDIDDLKDDDEVEEFYMEFLEDLE
jgi:ribosome-associated heat shock protein Hsp15